MGRKSAADDVVIVIAGGRKQGRAAATSLRRSRVARAWRKPTKLLRRAFPTMRAPPPPTTDIQRSCSLALDNTCTLQRLRANERKSWNNRTPAQTLHRDHSSSWDAQNNKQTSSSLSVLARCFASSPAWPSDKQMTGREWLAPPCRAPIRATTTLGVACST